MVESIKVFFSYSHRDEQLRDELAKHLSILQWQGVIASWHDRKITAGDEWAGEIDEHLNTAQIILLLISPDFMASRYCYDIEMKRAVARHDAGEARVIPIVLRPTHWKGASFGKLQALPKDAKAVTSWPNVDEAFVNIAEGIQAAVETMIVKVTAANTTPAKPTLPEKEPPTHIVDQMHRGDFVTISEAIAAANPGDRILVRSGLYQEGLVIDKPLEIIGDGKRDDIIVEASDQNVILFRTTRGRVASLTIRQIGGSEWYGVDITQGRLELEDCDITNRAGACVSIHDGADPRLRRNLIHDSPVGVIFNNNGRGVLDNNTIRGTTTGVCIMKDSRPILRSNEITGSNLLTAIMIFEGGGGIFENNDLRGNRIGAWYIDDSSLPNVIRRNNTPNE